MMEWKFEESSLEGIVDMKIFTTKKAAKDYLNQKVKEFKESNKEYDLYYKDFSKYYLICDYRLKADIEAEDEGRKDLGESGTPYRYFEVDSL